MKKSIVRLLELLRRAVRGVVPRRAYVGLARLVNICFAIRYIGLGNYLKLRRLLPGAHAPSSERVGVRMAGIQHPIFVRPGTSDAIELIQTCARRVHNQFPPRGEVRWIIDAGANIGDTTVWYLNRFPEAKVIAVEPDEGNFSLLEANCRPYGDRTILLRAAVWPREGEVLHIVGSEEPSGISVASGTDGAAVGCPSISMKGLLNLTPNRKVDIFKCDIEGAELQLFSEGAEEWLPSVRHIVIELHTPECHRAVFAATASLGFSCDRYRNVYTLQRSPA